MERVEAKALVKTVERGVRRGLLACCFCFAIACDAVLPAMAGTPVLESDGWRLHGAWDPVGSKAPAVLMLHDAAGDRNDFALLAERVNAAGMHALRLELRGHGASTNLGRFAPPYAEHLHINEFAWHDIVVGIDWLRDRPDVTAVAVVGASYSGEQAALALREGETLADAYVILSPGNFSDESLAAIDASGVPWLFLRTEQESPNSLRWIDEVFDALPKLSSTAEVRVYPGEGHASKMLATRPAVADDIARWLGGQVGSGQRK